MKTFDLTVSRTSHGSAEEVFDVWLDPNEPRRALVRSCPTTTWDAGTRTDGPGI